MDASESNESSTTNDLVLEKVQGKGEMNQKVEFLKKKPWRKAGANVTDYFNYGFDEKSWKAYCRKQAERRRMKRKLNAEIGAQRRHAGYEEEEASCAYSSPGRPSILAFREPIANLVGGQPESSRQDGRQRHNDGGSDTQVVCEMCHYEDSSKAYQLPPPLSNNSLFEVIKRRAPPCPQPPSSTATLVSPGVTDTAEARECYISQEKRDKDRDSSRAHGQDKENKGSRCREKEGRSSSYDWEVQMKHREPRNQGYKCCSDKWREENEQQRRWIMKKIRKQQCQEQQSEEQENSKMFSTN